MSFDDLPDDWPDRPLTDPRLVADVLDLIVSDADRRSGALAVLLCDGAARLVQPGIIGDLDDAATEEDRCLALGSFVRGLSTSFGRCASILFALARADGLSVTPDDRAWARAARDACGDDVRLLGFHLVTRHGSREVPATSG